jgi:NAD(P)-dependent dehydrogenase (short-subunit alcohol dehydrogenase family)
MSAQVAIVAGAGGELGRATTMALAARGRSLVAVDRSERGLLDLPSGIRRELADTTDPAGQAHRPDRRRSWAACGAGERHRRVRPRGHAPYNR